MKSITVNSKITSDYDVHTLNKLHDYCSHMKIQMEAITVNNQVRMRFSGSEDSLKELEDHLEGING